MVSSKGGPDSSTDRFLLIGGRLCVDFANTVYAPWRSGEALGGFDDLVDFLQTAGSVNDGEARRLRGLARANPRPAAAAFDRALVLRRVLRELLAALAASKSVQGPWVELVNQILRSDHGYPQLVAREGGWSLAEVISQEDPLAAALIPLARSAAELIEEGPSAPVRKCASPQCVLYFYDASPTGRRRWCSMAVCGNRAKVAAHARRGRA